MYINERPMDARSATPVVGHSKRVCAESSPHHVLYKHATLLFKALSEKLLLLFHALCLLRGLLRSLLVFTEGLSNELFKLSVLKLPLRLDELRLVPYWWAGDQSRAGREEGNGEVEGGHESACRGVARMRSDQGYICQVQSVGTYMTS